MAKLLFINAFSRRDRRLVIAVACLLIVSGCSLLERNRALPAPSEGFVVKGRLAIRTVGDGFSSNFFWEHAADRFAIELWGPIGQGRSRLESHRGGVVLHAADGSVHEEVDTQTAVRRWLGVDVPLAALVHWIRGTRAPGSRVADAQIDDHGNLVRLDQLAWVLDFSRYETRSDGRRLPGRIVATHAGAQAGEPTGITVTLLLKEWRFAEDPEN